MNQLKEFKRQVEIAGFVYENYNKYSEYELSDRFKVAQATLRRDFKALREMEVDIKSRKSRVIVDVNMRPLNSLLSSYIAVSTQNNIRNLKLIRQKFKNRTINLFVSIIKAINERRYLQIGYMLNEKDTINTRIIAPIYLTSSSKSFYVIAFENDELSFFRLEGIEKYSLTTERHRKEIPHLADIYKNSWGTYSGGEEIIAKLKFNRDKESYFKQRFLADYQEINYVSGGIMVEMKVKQSYEFIAWVMGWGSEVEIIGPEKLKEAVLLKAKGLLEKNKS